MTFHVGQRVVCVDDDWSFNALVIAPHRPRKRGIYIVRWIDIRHCGMTPGLAVGLREMVNSPIFHPLTGMTEPGFDVRRFRPVVERQTDISIFKEMLKETEAAE